MKSFIHISIIILSVLLTINKSIGQKVLYAAFEQSLNTIDSLGIMSFEIGTCEEKRISFRNINPPPSPFVTDITITPQGKVYGNSTVGLYLQYVDQYDGTGFGADTLYYQLESYYIPPFILQGDDALAIQSNEAGDIFCADINLWKYSPKTKKWMHLGILPDFYDTNETYEPFFISAKDGTLTKRKSDYYYMTTGKRKLSGEGIWKTRFLKQKIVRLDTLVPENSEVIFEFGDTVQIYGMFTIRRDCEVYDTYVAYCRFQDSTELKAEYWALGELDFDTGTIEELCKKGDTFYLTNTDLIIREFGVAVPWTILDSDCIVLVDLDIDNSSGTVGRYDYQDTLRCVYDSIYLSDIDPEVFSKTYIDSMQVFFASPTPDGADEYLEASNQGGLGIKWYNPKFVTFINNTNDDFLPLEVAVRSMVYRNISQTPTYGQRKIAFVAYSGRRQSDTAYAYINLIDDYPYAGRDTIVSLCRDDAPVVIDSLLTQGANTTGEWIGSTVAQGIFDPQADESMTLMYVVSKDRCEPDTARIEIEVEALPVFDLGADTTVCTGEVLELSCDTEAASYLWQDGSSSKSYEVSDSGLYILTIENAAGCIYTDSIKVRFYPDENTRVNLDTSICIGEKIDWHNQEISQEGAYEYSTVNIYGCDSLTVLQVSFYPITDVEIYGDNLFCLGDTIYLQGNNLSNYHWNTGDTTKQITVTREGWYYLESQDENGCTATDSIYIEQSPAIQIEVKVTDETCYGEEDGSITVEYTSGGIGDMEYYLNGKLILPGEEQQSLSPGQYLIEVSDSLGCRRSEEMTIASAPQLWVNLGEDITVEGINTELQLKADNNITAMDSVIWIVNNEVVDNNTLTFNFTAKENATIEVILFNTNGCEVRDTLNIEVIQKEEIEVYIPNIFTPDGDGMNDTWAIRTSEQIELIKYIAIYDRWGNQVFKGENIPITKTGINLWDGKYKDNSVNPGVYVYHLIFITHTGKTIQKSGDITVIQ